MAVDFLFTTLDTENELKQLRNFIYSRHLWYPNYEAWVDGVCIPEIQSGLKTAI